MILQLRTVHIAQLKYRNNKLVCTSCIIDMVLFCFLAKGGNQRSSQQSVERVPPVLDRACPSSIAVYTDPRSDSARVSWIAPTAEDPSQPVR